MVHLKKLAEKVSGRPIILFGILPVGPTSKAGENLAGAMDGFIFEFRKFFLQRWNEHKQKNIFFYDCVTLPLGSKNKDYFGTDSRPNQKYIRGVNSAMAGVSRAVSLGRHLSFCPFLGMKTQ
jgi:hypothetical protein